MELDKKHPLDILLYIHCVNEKHYNKTELKLNFVFVFYCISCRNHEFQ